MNNNIEQLLNAWTPVQESFESLSRGETAIETLVQELSAFSDVSRISDRDELARGSQQLSRLVGVAGTCNDAAVFEEIMGFVETNLQELGFCIGEDQPQSRIDAMIELSNEAWSDYFDDDTGSTFEAENSETSEAHDDQTPVEGIEQMLAALSSISSTIQEEESVAGEDVVAFEESDAVAETDAAEETVDAVEEADSAEEVDTVEAAETVAEETFTVDEEVFADVEEASQVGAM